MIATLIALAAVGLERTAPVRWSLAVEGVNRTALVFEGKPGGPVVIGFHGHGGTGRITAMSWGFHDLMPDTTFIYPDGLPTAVPVFDPEGRRPGWQVRMGQNEDRDIKFVHALREKVGLTRPTVIGGHSNGAFFTLLLWSQRDAKFAGAFEIAGAGLVPVNDSIPLMAVAGKEDDLIPFASQQNFINRVKREIGARELSANGFLTKYASRDGVAFWTYVHEGGHSVPSSVKPVLAEFVAMCASR